MGMKGMIWLFFLTTCLIGFASTSFTESSDSLFYPTMRPHTPESIMKLARAARTYYLETKDISEFNKNPGKFTEGVMFDYRYIQFADCETKTVLASPFFLNIVGEKSLISRIKDSKGKYHGLEACAGIKKYPDGYWVVAWQVVPNRKDNGKLVSKPFYLFCFGIKGTPYILYTVGRGLDRTQKELMEITHGREFTAEELNLIGYED